MKKSSKKYDNDQVTFTLLSHPQDPSLRLILRSNDQTFWIVKKNEKLQFDAMAGPFSEKEEGIAVLLGYSVTNNEEEKSKQ